MTFNEIIVCFNFHFFQTISIIKYFFLCKKQYFRKTRFEEFDPISFGYLVSRGKKCSL